MRKKTSSFRALTFMLGLVTSSIFAQSPTPTPPASAPQAGQPLPTLPRLAVVFPAGKPPDVCIRDIENAVRTYKSNQLSSTSIKSLFDFKSNQLCSIYLVLTSNQYQTASSATRGAALTPANIDKIIQIVTREVKIIAQQDGSSSGTGGSTNLASKGIAAKFISFASEYGALTESTSNLTTTVQGTLAGVPVVLLQRGVAEDCSTKLLALTPCFHHTAINWLNRISYSVSFDSSQNGQSLTGTASGQTAVNAQPATFAANSHTINEVSAKFIALRGGTVDASKFQDGFNTFINDKNSTEISETLHFIELLEEQNRAVFKPWQEKTAQELITKINSGADTMSLVAEWASNGTSFLSALGVPETTTGTEAAQNAFIQKIADLAVEYIAYIGREEQAALSFAKPPVLTFEYDNNRPAGQPTNSVFRAIYQRTFSQATVTGNGAFAIYNSNPSSSIPGASLLRDVQAAFQIDHDVQLNTPITGKLAMTATAAYYFQYQSSPAILNVNASSPLPGISFTGLPSTATQVFAQKGNISVGQLKLSIGSGSNVKVPISVTYSNRTELVTKPVWRAQVGISYDFDSLFQSSSSK